MGGGLVSSEGRHILRLVVESAASQTLAVDGEPFRSIAQRRLPDVIAEQIVAAIRQGSLKAGDRLPTEAELARRLGVGRTSVREGLQKLQTLGLVEVRKGRGAFVAQPPGADANAVFAQWAAESGLRIEELLEVRIALEAQAAGLAAVRATQQELDELDELNTAHREAGERGDLAATIDSDERFHELLFRISGNRLLGRLYDALIPEVTEFRRKSMTLSWAPTRSAQGHQAIIDAIRDHDAAAARQAMIDHIWVLYNEIADTATHTGHPTLTPAPREALG